MPLNINNPLRFAILSSLALTAVALVAKSVEGKLPVKAQVKGLVEAGEDSYHPNVTSMRKILSELEEGLTALVNIEEVHSQVNIQAFLPVANRKGKRLADKHERYAAEVVISNILASNGSSAISYDQLRKMLDERLPKLQSVFIETTTFAPNLDSNSIDCWIWVELRTGTPVTVHITRDKDNMNEIVLKASGPLENISLHQVPAI